MLAAAQVPTPGARFAQETAANPLADTQQNIEYWRWSTCGWDQPRKFVRWNAGLEQVGNAMAVMIRIIATTIGNSGMLRGAGFWRVHD